MLVYLAASLFCGGAALGWVADNRRANSSLGVPGRADALKVHFRRTLGVGDFQGFPELTLDAKQLSAHDLRQLQKLVDTARCFELSSSPTPPPHGPDPPAGFDLTVDRGGRRHTIWVTDGDVSPTLRPLVQWLTDRARKAAERDELIKIEFTKSGGIAGLHGTTKVDSSTLPAEEERQLRRLIAAARFFELPSDLLDTRGADRFQYTITIEMGRKRHTVEVCDGAVPAALQPLLTWLCERRGDAKAAPEAVEIEVTGKLEAYRHIQFGHTAVGITAEKCRYWLDYSKSVKELDGKLALPSVTVTGTLEFRETRYSAEDKDVVVGKRQAVIVVKSIRASK
ncbi:MAG TPA: protealysin inhibitor emfourin [Gemmataceae bacterium]|jgi:hypothetical protein|nr:protealysin inhibitor emfourin [Gemmataceae bacterium]